MKKVNSNLGESNQMSVCVFAARIRATVTFTSYGIIKGSKADGIVSFVARVLKGKKKRKETKSQFLLKTDNSSSAVYAAI